MNTDDLLKNLLSVQSVTKAKELTEELSSVCGAKWVPLGGRENNRGTVEIATNPARAIVERVTNSIDAVLEKAHAEHNGKPEVANPREAASAWLGIPLGGLSKVGIQKRQELAENVVVLDEPGDSKEARIISIRDRGTGLTRRDMPETILSLNASNKISKRYVSGTYGQGGSATFACCELSLIVSRATNSDTAAFTIVRYEDLPPDLYKTGHYVYLVDAEGLPFEISGDVFGEPGTLCRHIGFDLSGLDSPIGPSSIYGILGQVLFDPILPLWMESTRHSWKRRTIQGARNALLGATEAEPDDSQEKVSHSQSMYYPSLGDFGQIGIEYWLLAQPEAKKRPSAGYIDPEKPIIVTWNGQNQAELTHTLITKHAGLPLFKNRLIVHVNCDGLTPAAQRALFSSGREEARSGAVMTRIREEVLEVLKSDEVLHQLHHEAQEALTKDSDKDAEEATRKEVAKLLRIQGFDISATGAQGAGVEPATPPKPPKPPKPKPPFIPNEPPTFIQILATEGKPIIVHPNRSRHITIITDANSSYHNVQKPKESKINIVVTCDGAAEDTEIFSISGTTSLDKGRMRAAISCAGSAGIGTIGKIRVELHRPGLETLSDEKKLFVDTPPPPPGAGSNKVKMPPFDIVEVGPDDDIWSTLDWPDSPSDVASDATSAEGKLTVYFSNVYPPFINAFKSLASKSTAKAESFKRRYAIWIAAHSLILDRDQQAANNRNDDDSSEQSERSERCRYAVMAAMFAHQEVQEAGAKLLADAAEG